MIHASRSMLTALLLSATPLSAHTQATGNPLGIAADRYLAPLTALHVFSGVVLVARGDSILLEKAYGLADAELGVPMRPENVFRISSISKSFTRALVGRLLDKGVIGLDDPLSRWLPDFPEAKRITIQLLLDHRSGVKSMNSVPYDEEAMSPNTLRKLIDTLARLPLDFPPGTSRRYSNGGYAVLALVIETITGRRYQDVLAEELLAPAGLPSTRHQHDGEFIAGLAHGMMPSPEFPSRMMAPPFQEMATKAGGGSMVSTARDLFRWSRIIGTSPVLARATWKRLFPNDTSFAFSGRSPGYNSYLLHDGDITVIVLANNYAAGAVGSIADALSALAQGRTPEPLPIVAPTAGILAGSEGAYTLPNGTLGLPPGTAVEIRRNGTHLVAYVLGAPVDVLIPQGGATFLLRSLWSLAVFAEPTGGAAPYVDIKPLYGVPGYRAQRKGTTASP